jgi:phage terminase large subunit GpA-like protein
MLQPDVAATPPAIVRPYTDPFTTAALDRLEASARARAIPPPRLCVSDWLDQHRVIGRGYPSPFPGPWRTSRTPYLREPLDAFVDPDVEYLVLLFSSQVGKSEMQLGTLLYAYGVDPGPGMLVLPTLELAASVSTDRLSNALQSCGTLAVGTQRARTTDNAILHKRINSLPLTIAGANSAASLSSRPVRNLWLDEVDRFPATTPEGDPLTLAVQRTAAFRRRKIVISGTPTVKGASRIEDWYERSDKRVLLAPCPRCGERFTVEWHHVTWSNHDPDTAHIECPHCKGVIDDNERAAMFAAAVWKATAPASRIRGYRTWAIVSPWLRLSEMVRNFLEAKLKVETLQSWINLTRGESWEVPSEKVESASLLMRRETYAADVPKGAKVLTCGVDTQDDRLEALVLGWGPGEECWSIARETLFGDPAKPEVWADLDQLLMRDWLWEGGGSMRTQCTMVDALGHRTSAVYAAIVPRQHRRVFASFGKEGGDSGQVVSSPKLLATAQGNVIRYIIDVSQAKALIYSRLRLDGSGAGVMHFPMTVGDAFFTELTAEHLITERNKYGVPSKKWAVRAGHRRNETLDCAVRALAALRAICPTQARFDDLAKKIAETAATAVVAEQAAAARASSARPDARPIPSGAAEALAARPPGARAPRRPRTKGWNGG